MANNKQAELVDMFYYCETKPSIPLNLISREQFLDFLDSQLEEHKVLCVEGKEGVGVTIALALFAKRHGADCASYFNNGWSRHLLSPKTIKLSLSQQLKNYTRTELDKNEEEQALMNSIYRLNRMTRNKDRFIIFVFDGFDQLPTVYLDGIRSVLAPLFSLESSRFIFSGNKDDVKQLLPEGVTAKQTNELLKFQENDVQDYLRGINGDLTDDDIQTIYKLSNKGEARKLTILTEKMQRYGMEKINEYYQTSVDDFFADDYEWIEQQDKNVKLLMALLAFSEIPMNKQSVKRTLELSDEETEYLLKCCCDYVDVKDDGIVSLRSDDYRKYLRCKMANLKHKIEILLIDVIEKHADISQQFMFLPALYKHVHDNKQLVDYLTSENVQHFLVEQRSQAALNEQCEFGYNACSDFDSQAAAYFRFAINRSVSRELEKNELSDSEIEALMAIGDYDKAYSLTQNVFLMEEKLKCLLVIALAGKHLSDEMREEIDLQIDNLTDTIHFEHIPDKAIELVKLMLPIKMEKALEIIDRVAKVTQDRQQIDRLYTAISITFNNEGKPDDKPLAQRADIASSRIEDDELRKIATVMKTIMKDSTAAQVVTKMKELPASHQLNFLHYWIPNHKKEADVSEAVEYAVRLVIDTSQTMMPKVSFLKHYCQPLPDMPEKQVRTVVNMLDAVVANIKYPTIEYVKLMILVISAIVKFDKADAENRLVALYMEILDFSDKALQAHCKALLLRDFDKLGNPDDIEDWLGKPAKDLQEEIVNDISNVLINSAYHLKVVEGPIAALVCDYPDFVKKVIEKMNTNERKSRAYLKAAIQYLRQKDIKKLNWEYFIRLFHNITYDRTALSRPLDDLVDKIIEVNDKDQNLLENVKKHYDLFKEAEQAEAQCYYFAQLYVWLDRNYKDETDFREMVKNDLDTVWQLINVPVVKAETGYHIARVMSKISMKSEAHEYVAKAEKVRKNVLLSSVSCLTAYRMSFSLYAHSLGILIRSGLSTKDDIEQFKNLMDYDGSDVDAIIHWSRVALEYYGVNDKSQFDYIMNRFVTKNIEKEFSEYDQKLILYNIAPAMYLNSAALFYDKLKNYDDNFWNACLENVARYVQSKYPYPEYTNNSEIETQVALEKSDYDILLDLMRHTKDDNFIFLLVYSMNKSINQDLGSKLTREMKRALWSEMETVVKERLPMPGGIQHDGYLIACLTIIEGTRPGGKVEPETLKLQIEAIDNKADQAFLFSHASNYMPNTTWKAEFLEQALRITEDIDYTFDKFNRYVLCMQDAFTVAKNKVNNIANNVLDWLKNDKNGSYSDYQRVLDLVRDHDEQLADTLLEKFDDDPARVQYKKRLKERMQSSKKIEEARTNLMKVERLNNDEQIRFFARQMECLIKKMAIARDFNSTQPILGQIYHHPITDTQDAVLFFMENLHLKNQANKKYNSLLREMHQAIVDNLKIVVAIASGTQEKLARVNSIMAEQSDENKNMIQLGQADKGLTRIKDWYNSHPMDRLHIIDPYFYDDDMYIIKALMDLNNELNCSILTNKDEQKHKNKPLSEVFQAGWNAVSSDLTGRIEVKSCCFESDPKKTPFHDRWWILLDDDEKEKYGIRLASPSTLGSRITEISNMDDEAINSAMAIWKKFFYNMVKSIDGMKLLYDETHIR